MGSSLGPAVWKDEARSDGVLNLREEGGPVLAVRPRA